MSRNNDGLPMLPPWLSESEVTQVGYEAPVQNLPHQELIDEAPRRGRFKSRSPESDRPEPNPGRRDKRRKGWRRDKDEHGEEQQQDQLPRPGSPEPSRGPEQQRGPEFQRGPEQQREPERQRGPEPQHGPRSQPEPHRQNDSWPPQQRQQAPGQLPLHPDNSWQSGPLPTRNPSRPSEGFQPLGARPVDAPREPPASTDSTVRYQQHPDLPTSAPRPDPAAAQALSPSAPSHPSTGGQPVAPTDLSTPSAELHGVPMTPEPDGPPPWLAGPGSDHARMEYESDAPSGPRDLTGPPTPPVHGPQSTVAPEHGGHGFEPEAPNTDRVDAAYGSAAAATEQSTRTGELDASEISQRDEPQSSVPHSTDGPPPWLSGERADSGQQVAEPPSAPVRHRPELPPPPGEFVTRESVDNAGSAVAAGGRSTWESSTVGAAQQDPRALEGTTQAGTEPTGDTAAAGTGATPMASPQWPEPRGATSTLDQSSNTFEPPTARPAAPESAVRGRHRLASEIDADEAAAEPNDHSRTPIPGQQAASDQPMPQGPGQPWQNPAAFAQPTPGPQPPTGYAQPSTQAQAPTGEPWQNPTGYGQRPPAGSQAPGGQWGPTGFGQPPTGPRAPEQDRRAPYPAGGNQPTPHAPGNAQWQNPAGFGQPPTGPHHPAHDQPMPQAPGGGQWGPTGFGQPPTGPRAPEQDRHPPYPLGVDQSTPQAPADAPSGFAQSPTGPYVSGSAPAGFAQSPTGTHPSVGDPAGLGQPPTGAPAAAGDPAGFGQPPTGPQPAGGGQATHSTGSDQWGNPAGPGQPHAAAQAPVGDPAGFGQSHAPGGYQPQAAGSEQWQGAAGHGQQPPAGPGPGAVGWGQPQAGPHPGAPAQQHHQPGPHHLHMPQPSLDDVPLRRAKKAPGSGWRKAVHHVSGGAINPGLSAEEMRLQELVARIRQPVRGDYRIAVLSLKGGVGKTTTTMGLGSIFSSIRGDRVIAVDANPDFGTLSQRVPLQTRSTVRDLLLDPAIQRYSDVRRHTSQGTSRLEVLASERDPAASEAFSDDEYRAVARILQRFYNIILTDCGTGLMHSAMSGVLDLAHSLVLISSAAIDGARSAAATLDWLSLHGHDHLVRNAVVVINLPREGSPNVGIQQLREYFLSRCRAVHVIPYDVHLSEGAEIDLHRLHKTTKRAYVELAATVADEFSVDHRRYRN
ncbi:AAA family ATPase [Nocardia sp. NPDC057440]|uniref:nucleotide-binding protein n=1 Tax=Nocardia sp. NPDC057440 TaxID=3346134 RepID=UPI003672D917